MGLRVSSQPVLAAIEKQPRSQLRTLSMYVGMSALLTINAVRLTSSSNGSSLRFMMSPCTCAPHSPLGLCPRLSPSQEMATEFVNGTLGRVEEIVLDETNEEMVQAIRFRPDGSDNILTIPRRKLGHWHFAQGG
eukprot:scaffold19600_cov109-Phaeocystis_antarctica.AAC.3